jgi:hypothetical protein
MKKAGSLISRAHLSVCSRASRLAHVGTLGHLRFPRSSSIRSRVCGTWRSDASTASRSRRSSSYAPWPLQLMRVTIPHKTRDVGRPPLSIPLGATLKPIRASKSNRGEESGGRTSSPRRIRAGGRGVGRHPSTHCESSLQPWEVLENHRRVAVEASVNPYWRISSSGPRNFSPAIGLRRGPSMPCEQTSSRRHSW